MRRWLASWRGWSICSRATRATPQVHRRKTTIRAGPRRRPSTAVAARSGPRASSPGRLDRIWLGPTPLMILRSGSLKVGPRTPKPGKKKAERYLLVFCTELYTHYLLGDRSLATFTNSVLTQLGARPDGSAVIVHDRYQNYDSPTLGTLAHQLCTQHLLRDLDGAAQLYPDAIWPTQIADALRALIHATHSARDHGLDAITEDIKTALLDRFRRWVLVGLSDTLSRGTRPGENKARALLEVLRDRPADVLRFAHDLKVPPTSNQAERDLRPSKVQQNTSGRLTSEERTRDRYTIRGYVSTAIKHGHDAITVLRDALTGNPWIPALPTPT